MIPTCPLPPFLQMFQLPVANGKRPAPPPWLGPSLEAQVGGPHCLLALCLRRRSLLGGWARQPRTTTVGGWWTRHQGRSVWGQCSRPTKWYGDEGLGIVFPGSRVGVRWGDSLREAEGPAVVMVF